MVYLIPRHHLDSNVFTFLSSILCIFSFEVGSLPAGDQGTKWLSEKFSLCQPLQHVSQLVDWVVDTWFNLAMSKNIMHPSQDFILLNYAGDYPFPASFLEPLPAWPIKVSHVSIHTCIHVILVIVVAVQ